VDEKEYSLIEHLSDLRDRLMKATIGVVVVAILAFYFSDQLLEQLRGPMTAMLKDAHGGEARFVVISPAEYLICQMKVALVAAIFLSSPWTLYQIWLFISPGLYDHEKRYVSLFVWAGALCFVGGAAFAHLVVFPQMFKYFVESLPPDIAMTPTLSEHLSFTLKMLLAFGAVFETPVIVFILSIAGIIDPSKLGQYRRYVVVVAFVIGAILTPTPDMLSQLLLAGPLLALYEAGVLVSRLAVKMGGTPLSRKERAEQFAATTATTTTPEPTTPSA
jgi:sec-independent protein translocase protein TatC